MGRYLAAVTLVAALVGMVPVLAATVDISIPIETVVRGPAGSQHVLVVVGVPEEHQGETCNASAVSRNQRSEHPDSDLLVSSATSVEILDVENTAFGSVFAGGLITLGDTITVTLTLGADGRFSGGIDVQIDCPPFGDTTTTTVEVLPSSSVTGETTSSTAAVTSSTVAATSSTAAAATSSTDTSIRVLQTTVTAPTTSAAVAAETLPFTGPSDTSRGGIAVALVALGGLVLLAVRRREEATVVIAEGWSDRLKTYHV